MAQLMLYSTQLLTINSSTSRRSYRVVAKDYQTVDDAGLHAMIKPLLCSLHAYFTYVRYRRLLLLALGTVAISGGETVEGVSCKGFGVAGLLRAAAHILADGDPRSIAESRVAPKSKRC